MAVDQNFAVTSGKYALDGLPQTCLIDAEGRVGPLWTCKEHRTELWMKVGDGLVAPLEWWPD